VSVPALAADKPFDDGVKVYSVTDESYQYNSIVQLMKFDASRSTSEAVRREIMMINSDITYSIETDVNIAQRAFRDETYEGSFEIRAYPYTTDKYLQVVATSIEYPTYGRDPDAYSFVYDRTAKKYVRVSDALIEDGLTEDEILKDAEKLYIPSNEDYLFGGKICGIYMVDDSTRAYILRMNMINPLADDWLSLMTYVPGKYTEDGKAELFQNVKYDENFTPVKVEAKESDNDNKIFMNVNYRNEDATDYIRFLRDRYAVMKIDGKLSIWFYYKTSDNTICFQKLTENFEGTLEHSGIKLTVNIDGEDILFVPETISANYFN
jgi:hypothetical protein